MSAAARAPEIAPEALEPPQQLDGRRLRNRVVAIGAVILLVAAVITLAPGLDGLRSRLSHGHPGWLVLGVALKVLSGLAYVAVFRAVFCRRMTWRLSTEIGLAELGANAILPTGGVGGLALGAWALRRGGMARDRIARRSVAFFFLTSLPNVLGVIVIGLALALGILRGRASLVLSLIPALVAIAAIVLTLVSGRLAGTARERLAQRRGPQSRLPHALGAIADGVRESLLLLRQRDPWLLVGLIGYLAFDVLILAATFRAFGPAPPLAIISIGYLIGELGGLLPVPGGIGGVDLGLVGALVVYHVPVGAATAAVLAYRAIALWIPAVLGSAAFVMLRRSLSREAEAISNCAAGDEIELIGRGMVRLSSR